jgi:PAS domain S-box-containing protein
MAGIDLRTVSDALYLARGDNVLDELVESLMKVLGVDYAFVSQLIDQDTSYARTLSFFVDGKKADNFQYDLLGGPCMNVHGREACIFNGNVQQVFPDDRGLIEKGVETYIGIPLFSSVDGPVGIVAVMNRTPLDNPESVRDLLQPFAARAANELDWRQRESALKQSEAKFRSLVEGSIQGIYIHRDMQLLFVNRTFAEMLGYDSPEDLMDDRSLLRLFHPDEHERVLGFKDRRLAGEDAPSHYEARFLRRDGAVVWVENNAHLIEWDGERAIQSTNIDITDRMHAEDRLKSILENITDGVFRTNQEGQLLWANTALARMAGFQDGPEMVSRITDVASEIYVNPDDRRLLLEQLREKGHVREFLAQFRAPKTEEILWCSTNCRMSVDPAGKIYIDGVVRDVTETRRNDERLRRVEKMQAIGQLTGGIAHDFNNLLGIVIGNLDMLEEDAGDDEKLGRPIATALRAALRGATLTKRLLAFARQSGEEAKPVDLNKVIANLRAPLAKLLTTDIQVDIFLGDGLWLAAVNEGDFEDVIFNLAVNAQDAMPQGGSLIIETKNTVLDALDKGAMDDIPPDGYVMISVSDNGCGMSKEVVDQIFEPFFTTKPVGKGTGLGMSLVYGFTQRSNGYVRVYSEPSAGTTIRIFLPRFHHSAEEPSPTQGLDVVDLHGSEVVLIVDDELDLAILAQKTLENLGYQVLVAENAENALLLLEQHPNIDILFTDIVMPGTMNGLDLAEQSLKRYPNIKVLVASGFSGKIPLFYRHSRFQDSLLAKPYRLPDMVRRIRHLLDHEPEIS